MGKSTIIDDIASNGNVATELDYAQLVPARDLAFAWGLFKFSKKRLHMSRGTVSSQDVAQATGVPVTTDAFIQQHLDVTRQQVKFVEISTHLITLFTIALSYLLIAAVVDHWILPLGIFGRAFALLALVGGIGYYVYKFVVPLLIYRISPLYAARTIERAQPSLKNSLINFLQLRKESGNVPQVVLSAMEYRAANDIAAVQVDTAVDRRQLLFMGYVLAAVIALVGVYRIASSKNPFTSFYRVLIPWAAVDQPSRVQIEDIEPGDTLVRHGNTVEVTALIRNLREGEDAVLYYTTADGQVVDQAIVLTPGENRLYFSTTLPPTGDGIQQAISYRIEAGDVATRDYDIEVQPNPTILLEQLTLDFPKYTKREQKVQPRQGDIRAVEGTRVTIVANSNLPISEAYLQLEGSENGKAVKRRVKMKSSKNTATHAFYLQLKSDRSAAQYATYRLDFSTEDGRHSIDSVTHHIDVLPDLAPEIEILTPEKSRTEVRADGMQTIEVRALDPDFGLQRVVLRAVAGGDELFTEELFSDAEGAEGQQLRYFQFTPNKYRLKPGDVVSVQARAEDNRVNVLEQIPAPNSQRTPVYSLVITDPSNGTGSPNGQPGNEENPKNSDPKNSDPKNSDPKNSDPKNSDPKNSDPKNSDPKNSDPKNSDPKNSDPNSESGNNDQTNNQNGNNADGSDGNSKTDGSEDAQDGNSSGNQSGTGANDSDTDGNTGDAKQAGNKEAGSNGNNSTDPSNSSESDGNTPAGNSSGSPAGNTGSDSPNGNSGNKSGSGSPSGSKTGSVTEGEGSSEPQHPGESFEEIIEHMKKNGLDKPNSNSGSGANSPNQNSTQRPTDGNTDPGLSNAGEHPENGNPQSDPNSGSPQNGTSGDPKSSDPKSGDPKSGDPKSGDPKSGDPDNTNPSNSGDGNKPEGDPNAPKENSPAGDSAAGSEDGNKPKDPNANSSQGSPSGTDGNKPDGNKPDANKTANESDPNGSGGGEQPQPNSQKTNSGDGANGGSTPKDAQNKPKNGGSEAENGPPGGGDKGESGGGEKSEDNSGSGPPQEENKDRNKSGSNGGSKDSPQDPSSPSNGKTQSSSEGDASGDKPGGGKSGGGQSAGQPGNENAGSNSPSDQGANTANEPGTGDTGAKGGTQQKSDHPTGSPGNEKGNGTESRPASDGNTTKPGQNDSANEDGSTGGASGGPPSNSGKPSGPQQGITQRTSDGVPGGGGKSVAGNDLGNGEFTPDGSQVPDGEAANLDYTRKATEMALDYLEDQKHNPDPELLKKMNWSKDDLNKFVDKWTQLKSSAVEGEKGDRDYDDTLRGLGLREQNSTRRNAGSNADELRGLSESGHQTKPPAQYQELFRAFKKGTARADQ
ncbi:MAG: hypothetical protein ACI9G1_003767 [Pirellulaceae bacterium]